MYLQSFTYISVDDTKRHMVKDHSARKETRCRHIEFFYIHHPTDRIVHTTAFVTPVVEHWLEREIAQWVHPMKDRFDDNL